MEEQNKRNLLNIYYLEVKPLYKAISIFLRFSLIFSVCLSPSNCCQTMEEALHEANRRR